MALWRWDSELKKLVEVGKDDVVVRGDNHNRVVGDLHYEGLRAPDGAPINSRRKHREYMKVRGLTMAEDYTNTWKQAEQERAKRRVGDWDHSDRRDTIGRVAYELENRRGR